MPIVVEKALIHVKISRLFAKDRFQAENRQIIEVAIPFFQFYPMKSRYAPIQKGGILSTKI